MTAEKPRKTTPTPCIRCGGGGYVNSVVEGGICFRCHGNRHDPKYRDWTFPAGWTDDQTAAFLAAEAAKAAAKQAKKDAARKEAEAETWAANVAECPELAELDATGAAVDLCHRLRRWRISDKQKPLAVAILDRHRATLAREAEAEQRRVAGITCPEGRQTIRGTVAGFKTKESRFGTVEKMIVRHSGGWAVYLSVPAGIRPARGDTVEFTATVTRSDRDPLFGFGSRPTQARIVAEETTEVA